MAYTQDLIIKVDADDLDRVYAKIQKVEKGLKRVERRLAKVKKMAADME